MLCPQPQAIDPERKAAAQSRFRATRVCAGFFRGPGRSAGLATNSPTEADLPSLVEDVFGADVAVVEGDVEVAGDDDLLGHDVALPHQLAEALEPSSPTGGI